MALIEEARHGPLNALCSPVSSYNGCTSEVLLFGVIHRLPGRRAISPAIGRRLHYIMRAIPDCTFKHLMYADSGLEQLLVPPIPGGGQLDGTAPHQFVD